MTKSLTHSTIVIVQGRSLATFKLRSELEDQGASVCVASPEEAAIALRNVKPSAVIVDFSLAGKCDELTAYMEEHAVPHLYCRAPNRHQTFEAQTVAAQDVTVALAELLNDRQAGTPSWQSTSTIDPELYAI